MKLGLRDRLRSIPERLIFIDESGLSTKMARLRGWAPKGERCRAAVPHGHWNTTTFVGGLTLTGICAPMLLDGPMDGDAFLAWCEQMLAPMLRSGDVVIMDNLPAHKVAGVRVGIEATGATCSTCRPTVPTSTQLRTPSQSSKPTCERPPPEPSTLWKLLLQMRCNIQTNECQLLRTRRLWLGLMGICSRSYLVRS